MKMLEFRRATIQPLWVLSVYIAEMQTDDGVENFHKYYIADDFGNSVEIPVIGVHGFSPIEYRQIY